MKKYGFDVLSEKSRDKFYNIFRWGVTERWSHEKKTAIGVVLLFTNLFIEIAVVV